MALQFHHCHAGPQVQPGAPMTTIEDFTENYLEIRENVTLSRVEVVIKDQSLQITLDRENNGQDLFVNVLGFATTQTLHSPANTWHRRDCRERPHDVHLKNATLDQKLIVVHGVEVDGAAANDDTFSASESAEHGRVM